MVSVEVGDEDGGAVSVVEVDVLVGASVDEVLVGLLVGPAVTAAQKVSMPFMTEP